MKKRLFFNELICQMCHASQKHWSKFSKIAECEHLICGKCVVEIGKFTICKIPHCEAKIDKKSIQNFSPKSTEKLYSFLDDTNAEWTGRNANKNNRSNVEIEVVLWSDLYKNFRLDWCDSVKIKQKSKVLKVSLESFLRSARVEVNQTKRQYHQFKEFLETHQLVNLLESQLENFLEERLVQTINMHFDWLFNNTHLFSAEVKASEEWIITDKILDKLTVVLETICRVPFHLKRVNKYMQDLLEFLREESNFEPLFELDGDVIVLSNSDLQLQPKNESQQENKLFLYDFIKEQKAETQKPNLSTIFELPTNQFFTKDSKMTNLESDSSKCMKKRRTRECVLLRYQKSMRQMTSVFSSLVKTLIGVDKPITITNLQNTNSNNLESSKNKKINKKSGDESFFKRRHLQYLAVLFPEDVNLKLILNHKTGVDFVGEFRKVCLTNEFSVMFVKSGDEVSGVFFHKILENKKNTKKKQKGISYCQQIERESSFLFSLVDRRKYKIKNKNEAAFYSYETVTFGDTDLQVPKDFKNEMGHSVFVFYETVDYLKPYSELSNQKEEIPKKTTKTGKIRKNKNLSNRKTGLFSSESFRVEQVLAFDVTFND